MNAYRALRLGFWRKLLGLKLFNFNYSFKLVLTAEFKVNKRTN